MKSHHVYTGIVLALLVAITCYHRHITLEQQSAERDSRTRSVSPSFAMTGVDFTAYDYRDEGPVKKSRIEGQRMQMESKKFGAFRFAPVKELVIKNVSMTFFDEERIISTLTADHAWIDIPWENSELEKRPLDSILGKRINFRGNVRVSTPEKKSFQCGSIQLSENQKQLFGDDNCVVRMDDQIVSAGSMQADLALTQVHWR
ncbi:MAG: hypothetical protein K8I00_04060 [Candidatus Omnitrophica bacterium]|nr:hypothetical protein [Candidatus Omnitrophota bacterium]